MSNETGRLEGQVALITGGARGQGRSHALALASEGADIAICDVAADITTVPYPLARPDDLAETVRLIEGLGRRCFTRIADVRDTDAMNDFARDVVTEFGRIDICLANAGVCGFGQVWELTDTQWSEMIDIDLTGVFKTVRAVLPQMIEQKYGRIVATSSLGGRMGNPNLAHYVAAKWGVIGLIKTVALEVAKLGITANAIAPASVDSDMLHNPALYGLFCPDLTDPTKEDVEPRYVAMNAVPRPWLDAAEVSRAILFLVTDTRASMTGEVLELGLGTTASMH